MGRNDIISSGDNEKRTNQTLMFEWSRVNKLWVQRQNVIIGRGHFSSFVVPYKEHGFLLLDTRSIDSLFWVVNTITGHTSKDIYYKIGSDSWTTIGNLPERLYTPVCDIENSIAYCQTGPVGARPFHTKSRCHKFSRTIPPGL